MIYDLVVFVVSLLVLAKASHSALKSSVNLAKHLGIGEFAIGFIFIAVMTSLPELFVSIMAGLNSAGDIVVGNVIGSNIANTLFVLGVVAFFQGIAVTKQEFVDNAGFLFGISAIALALLYLGSIGLWSGVILILVFLLYAVVVLKTKISLDIQNALPRTLNFGQVIIKFAENSFAAFGDFIMLGIAMAFVIASSHFFVQSAISVATLLGVSPALIALTVIAFGTSLPELAIAVHAILTGRHAIALGEIIGSSIVNLTLVLGTGALFTTIPFDFVIIGSSLIIMVLINLVLWYLMSTRELIGKRFGAAFIVAYVLFLLLELGVLPFVA